MVKLGMNAIESLAATGSPSDALYYFFLQACGEAFKKYCEAVDKVQIEYATRCVCAFVPNKREREGLFLMYKELRSAGMNEVEAGTIVLGEAVEHMSEVSNAMQKSYGALI